MSWYIEDSPETVDPDRLSTDLVDDLRLCR